MKDENWEKARNLELVGASPTEWQLITPRGGQTPPASNRVNVGTQKNAEAKTA